MLLLLKNIQLSFLRAAILIPILDTLTSIFAAFTVFSVLGVIANKQGIDVREVLR